MPRQISPGPKYKGWIPNKPDQKDEDYVFPELRKMYEFSDEDWDSPEGNEEVQRYKAQYRVLQQSLESCLMIMFNDWFKGFDTEARRIKAKGWLLHRSNGLFSGSIFDEKEDVLRGTLLWLDYCRRIIDSEATGHYVYK